MPRQHSCRDMCRIDSEQFVKLKIKENEKFIITMENSAVKHDPVKDVYDPAWIDDHWGWYAPRGTNDWSMTTV